MLSTHGNLLGILFVILVSADNAEDESEEIASAGNVCVVCLSPPTSTYCVLNRTELTIVYLSTWYPVTVE